jgi:hypothetical protein
MRVPPSFSRGNAYITWERLFRVPDVALSLRSGNVNLYKFNQWSVADASARRR